MVTAFQWPKLEIIYYEFSQQNQWKELFDFWTVCHTYWDKKIENDSVYDSSTQVSELKCQVQVVNCNKSLKAWHLTSEYFTSEVH